MTICEFEPTSFRPLTGDEAIEAAAIEFVVGSRCSAGDAIFAKALDSIAVQKSTAVGA